jgi:hypothetical protein
MNLDFRFLQEIRSLLFEKEKRGWILSYPRWVGDCEFAIDDFGFAITVHE